MSHSLRYEVNCSILFTELPLLAAAGRRQGRRIRRRRVLVAVQRRGADRCRGRRVRPGDRRRRRRAGRAELLRRRHGRRRPRSGLLAGPLRRVPGQHPGGRRRSASGWAARRSMRCTATGSTAPRPREQDDLGAENLALAAQGVAAIGGTVLVEPVSGSPRYPLLTAADVAAVIDRVTADGGVDQPRAARGPLPPRGQRRRRRQGDRRRTPASRAGSPTCRSPTRPGRGAPGTGDLPLDRQLADLEAAGYRGWVGLEYKVAPAENPDTAASFDFLPRARRASN